MTWVPLPVADPSVLPAAVNPGVSRVPCQGPDQPLGLGPSLAGLLPVALGLERPEHLGHWGEAFGTPKTLPRAWALLEPLLPADPESHVFTPRAALDDELVRRANLGRPPPSHDPARQRREAHVPLGHSRLQTTAIYVERTSAAGGGSLNRVGK